VAIIYEKLGAIAIITLNRPGKLNAVYMNMLKKPSQSLDDYKKDDLKVAIATRAGMPATVFPKLSRNS
jgi:enoyl-CoA hydratase/carnithine racemase